MRILLVFLLLIFNQQVFAEGESADPLEKMNRKIQVFNDQMDKYLLRPVAKGYDYITPRVVNKGITNMFSMVAEVPNTANALLQGNFRGAGRSISRFFVNLTLGGLGFFDVASKFGIAEQNEDFGQTLAVWGVPAGPYVVLPFFGPSNLRDSGGLVTDLLFNPLNYEYAEPPVRNTIWLIKVVDRRADLIKVEDLVTGDRYSFFKTTYEQHRNYLIQNGKVEDNFGEEDLDDDWLEE